MTKRTYIQPCISIVLLQHKHQLLNASNVQANGLGGNGLGYDNNGGDQNDAW